MGIRGGSVLVPWRPAFWIAAEVVFCQPCGVPSGIANKGPPSLGAKVGGRGSLAAGYSAHKKAQSRPGFGLLRASVLTSNREEKQLVL